MDFDFQKFIQEMEDLAKNNDIGKNLMNSIGVSMDAATYMAVTSLENVYVELGTVTKNAQKNAEKIEKKRQDRELKNLKNCLDLQLITEQEYYERLKEYRDQNLRKGSDMWYKITDDIIQYNKRLWTAATKEQQKYEKAEEQFMEKLGNIRDKLNEKVESIKIDFAEQISGLEQDLFENLKSVENDWVDSKKIRFIKINNGRDLVYNKDTVNDFKEEINTLERFYQYVTELKALGYFPDEFFVEIANMDAVEATKIMGKLLAASDEKRKAFADGYIQKNALAEKIAEELNPILNKSVIEDIAHETVDALNSAFGDAVKKEASLGKALEKFFSDVPQEYYSIGEKSATAFGEGFDSMIETAMGNARQFLMEMMDGFAEDFSVNLIGLSEKGSTNSSNVYNNSYTFNSSRETTTEQLAAAKAAASLEKLRGGN